ncbi:MAG TPA: glycosyltransferase family 4 protein [Polyangia bacterium]|jgi:phosphatidylinositol alpha-mannosyltransferase|nr:glycosyltransferase family 4 protein [Polyangia bacterium]
MRVCQLIPYDLADVGGVKRHALNLAAALREGGDEVWVIGPSSAPPGVREAPGPWMAGFGGIMHIPAHGWDNPLGMLVRPWEVVSFFRQHRFDVLHVHEPLVPTLGYYALGMARRMARVCTFHSFVETEALISRVARRVLSRPVLGGFHRGIAVSRPAERFARYTWRGPLAVIPNGVPTDVFCPGPAAAAGGEALAPASPQRPLRVLFVGQWRDPRKGFPHLLEAFRRLRERGVPVVLDVVGHGGTTPPEVPGVVFHGTVTDEARVAAYHRASDLFVSPAMGKESFGIVLLEAMATGRAIVCSDIEGYRQVVSAEGAHWVPPGDAVALAQAIEALARDPARRRRMGEVNRARAEQFSWRRLAAEVRAEYVAALEHRTG